MLHLLLAFATIAFALNSLEVQNEQLKKTNEALRNALRAMKTNKEATVVAEVMVGAGYCPSGWELTFPGHPDGECQQEPTNDGETRVYDAQTVDACKEACASDSSCVAFDFLSKSKYCFKNTRCDKQDQGDGYLSCKRVQTGEESIGSSSSNLKFIEHQGYCRTPSNGRGWDSLTEHKGVQKQDCEKLCNDDASCRAYEYTPRNSRCEIHTGVISHADGRSTASCFVKGSDATAGFEKQDDSPCRLDGSHTLTSEGCVRGQSLQECADRCRSDPTCMSFDINYQCCTFTMESNNEANNGEAQCYNKNSKEQANGKKVCHKDQCKGTWTNPIPKGEQWVRTVKASDKGCCAFGRDACDWCIPSEEEI